MTKVMPKKVKRDKVLIKDYESGDYDMAELVGKYKITPTRIYQILNYYDIPRKGKHDRQKAKA